MKKILKFLIFFFTPHLLFDKIQYMLAKVDVVFAKSIRGKKNVYIFLCCDYANLGDYAITLAQQKILRKKFPEHNVVLVAMNDTYSALKAVVRNNQTDDIVTLIGGGNMGDMYYGFERKRNLIVSKLSGYRIVSFPQTISFSNSPLGKLCLRRTMRVYSRHRNLTLLAREKQSFEMMQRYFPKNKVLLTPDIVMTYTVSLDESKRQGIVLTFRNDGERSLSEEERDIIVGISKEFGAVSFYDTCPKRFDNLETEFRKLLEEYSRSKLVLTDRLHGMIFAYITGTPALVFENSNGKILHCFEWIKDCGFIRLVKKQDIPRLGSFIKEVLENQSVCLKTEEFERYILNLN